MGVKERYENRIKNKKEKEEKKSNIGVAERYEMRNFTSSLPERLENLTSTGSALSKAYISRFTDKDGNYINAYRGDTKDALSSFETSKANLESESKAILEGLSKYGQYLDADKVKGIQDYLSGYSGDLESMYEIYKTDYDNYSRYADEDSYNRAMDYAKEQEEKKNKYSSMSDDELEAEIERLEGSKKDNKLFNLAMMVVGAQHDAKYNTDFYGEAKEHQAFNDSVDNDISLIEKEKTNRKYKQIDKLPEDVRSLIDELTVIDSGNDDDEFVNDANVLISGLTGGNNVTYNADSDSKRFGEIVQALESKGVKNWNELLEYNKLRYNEKKNAPIKQEDAEMAKEHWITSSLATIPASLGKGMGVIEMLENIGSDVPLDPNSPYFSANNFVNTTRETVMDEHDFHLNTGNETLDNIDLFDELYGTAMSTGDSLMTVGLGGMGGVALGLSAASDSAQEIAENGGSSTEAIVTGLVSGMNEMLWESLSLGRLNDLITNGVSKRGFKAFVDELFKSMGINASEELNTEASNLLADYLINGGASTYSETVQNYLALGYTDNEAKAQAGKGMLVQMAKAGVGGALQGLFMGVGGGAISSSLNAIESKAYENKYYNNVGQSIIDQGNLSQLEEEANALGGKDVLKALKNLADETAGVKTEELDAKGKKKYAKQVGKLYKGVQEAQFKNLGNSDKTAYKNIIKAELEKAGVTNADEAADVLVKRVFGEDLTRAENRIFQSVNGLDIINKVLSSAELDTEKLKRRLENKAKFVNTLELARDVKAEILEDSGFKISSDGKTTIDATDENVDSITIDSLDGEDISLNVKTGDSSQVVLASELRLNEDIAIIIDFLREIKDDFGLDASSANAMLNLWNGYKGNALTFSRVMRSGIMYGQYNMRMDFENDTKAEAVPKNIREEMFNVGREYRQRVVDEQQAFAEADAVVPNSQKKGNKVTFAKGVVYDKLTERQKAQVDLTKALAKKYGYDLEVFRSPKNESGVSKGENGSYSRSRNLIRLDVDSGTVNGKPLIIFTQAHELTHFIKKWSPAKFKAFADFLVETYDKRGKSLQENIEAKIYNSIKKHEEEQELIKKGELDEHKHHILSYDEAFEEVVCNFAEEFLADPNIQKRVLEIDKKDKSLGQKIKEFLRNLINRLEKALEGLSGETKETELLHGLDAEEVNALKEKWLEALGDARVNVLRAKKRTVAKDSKVLSASEKETLDDMGIGFDEQSNTVYSIRYTPKTEEEAVKLAQLIAKGTGRTFADSYKWVQAEMSIAHTIMRHSEYLDYEADDRYDPIKTNSDYPQGTVDLSNHCPKRIEFTAIFDRLQKTFPNKIITAMDIANMRNILKENGVTVACGVCFVDDRRQLVGEIAHTFTGMWKDAVSTKKPLEKTNDKGAKVQIKITEDMAKEFGLEKGSVIYAEDTYIPNQYDLTTYEGFKLLSKNHPSIAMAFQIYNNSRGQQAARLVEGRAEYDRQILKWSDDKVKKVNDEGGLRIFSFSDFEIVHLIDLVQVIMDCAARGVKIQGYTKRPEFARLVRNTGVKLNRSLIPRGRTGIKVVNGVEVLDYDNVEGIDTKSEHFIDERDNNNVGNILIGINDKQIRMAMLDDFIDYIIPFHSNKRGDVNDRLGLNGWENYKKFQHDKNASTGKAAKHNINIYTQVIAKYNPKNKVEFVNAFLAECKVQNIIPRYEQFIDKDADGNYVYTEGYHKFLVDFKLFDKEGNILLQENVVPNFEEDFMQELLQSEVMEKENYQFPDKVYKQIVDMFGESDETYFQDRVTPEQDAEYLELAKDPKANEARLREMVEEAAKKAGYDTRAFHGTNSFGFTKFDPAMSDDKTTLFFTDDKRVASTYAGRDVYGVKKVSDARSFNYEKGRVYTEAELLEAHDVIQSKYHVYGVTKVNVEKQTLTHAGTRYSAKQVIEMADRIVKEGIYDVFLNTDNFIEVDAKYSGWSGLKNPLIDEWKWKINYQGNGDFNYFKAKADDMFRLELLKNGENVYSDSIQFSEMYSLLRKAIGDSRAEMAIRHATNGSGMGSSRFETAYSNSNGGYANPNMTTRELAQYAKTQGYKGVKIENLYDWGNRNSPVTARFAVDRKGSSTIYILFDSNQVKSADPVTYDDNGDIIPLSERFNEGNDDIRYQDRYWYPKMPHTDFNQIKMMAKIELPKPDKYIDSITKWLYNTKNGKNYFAIYSTEDKKDPTILFASLNKQAVIDRDLVEIYIDMLNNIGVTDDEQSEIEQSGTFDEIFDRAKRTYVLRSVHSGESLGRRTDNGDVSVHSQKSPSGPSRTLLNCLRDCYERRNSERGISKLTDERIQSLFTEYGASNPQYAQAYITSIHPRDFLKLTLSDDKLELWNNAAEKGTDNELYSLDLEKLKGNSQTPYLTVDTQTGEVIGHEGRHRMRALLESGVTSVPIAIVDYRTKYSKQKEASMKISSQDYGDGAINDNFSTEIYNLIPLNKVYEDDILSQYGGEGDIKFQDRPISDREVLVDAMSNIEELSIEDQNRLKIYKGKIENINELEKELAEVGKQIHKIITTKGSDRKKMAELNAKADTLRKQISRVDGELLRIEAMKPIQNLVEIRKKQVLKAHKQKVQEQRHKNVEGRHKTATKNKIKRVVKELDKLLNKGNKKANVKDGMQDMVRKALALSDLLLGDVVSAETILSADIPDERLSENESEMLQKWRNAVDSRTKFQTAIDNLEAKYGSNKPMEKYEDLVNSIAIANKQIKKAEKNLSELLERERKRLNSDSVKEAITSLSKAYETLKESNVDYISSAYDEYISDKLKNLVESLEGVNVKDMSMVDLQEVYTAYKMVLTTVRNANKLFVNGRKEDFDEINGLILQEINSHKEKRESKFEPIDKVLEGARNFTHNNLKPLYFFEELGSNTLKRIFYNEIARAQRVYAVDFREAREYIENARKKHNYYSWNNDSQTIKLLDGRTVKFSMQELMSIYAYSKRPQADKHMSEGGFAFDNKAFFKDVEVDVNGKKVKTRELRSDAETPYRITEFELAKIKKLLGKERCEYVDDMQKYLSEDMANKGNSVTRVMYGIDIFNEKVYFPLKSSKDYKIPVSTTNAEFALKGSGWTKETVPSARNPIVLEGFDDVWGRHVNEMSTYHSLVLPIENMNKVLGYTEYINTPNSLSTKQIIRKVYGSSAVNYIENYIQDMNGGFSSNKGAQNLFAKGFSNFKKTAVGASMSTVIQQPTAVVRAMAMINPKYFVKYETVKHKVLQEEMLKYAPISIIKQIGGFDAGGNRSAVSSLLSKEYKGIDKAKAFFEDKEYRKESFDDAMMLGATFADEIGWNIIWNAVKNEVKDTTTFMPGTDEFLNECGNRFDEVINATQVYDSVLSRSGYMRSNNELVKMSTAFMGEPSTSFNMLYNAVTQAKRGNISKPKAVGIVTSVYVSVIAAAALKSLIYALRDDDDEESYVEKYMSALFNSLKEDVWIHNMLPFLSDIATMFDGWEVERTDMAAFKDVIDAFDGLKSSSKSDWRKAEDLFGAFAGLFGIPLKNVMRTGREIYNAYANICDGITADEGDVGNAITESIFGETSSSDINEALEKGNTAKAKKIINDLVADKVKQDKTQKEAKASIKASVTSYWKELYLQAYRDKDNAEMLRIRQILQSTGLYDNVVQTCSNWIKSMKDEITNTTYKKR